MSLIHAGGAAATTTTFPGLSPNGIGIMKSTLLRLSLLDFTQYGSLLALASLIPPTWKYLLQIWPLTGSWIKHFFISSVTLPAGDPCNRNVSTWVNEHVISKTSSMRFFTARTAVSNRDLLEPGGGLLKKNLRAVQYFPHWNSTWFWFNSRLFMMKRSMKSFEISIANDPTYDGVGGEEITISCLGLSARPIREFIEKCRQFAEQKEQYYVIIYSRDRYGMAWKAKYRKPLRRLDTVHLDAEIKGRLIGDIRNYLDVRTQRLYQSRSMPYRRGYLLEGLPGTGKSTLSAAIAGEFGLDLYELKIPSIGSDADLEHAFQEIPPRCIVLLEDIDCVWSRDHHHHHHHQTTERLNHDADSITTTSSNNNNNSSSKVTLSGLLNVLDGVGSQEGRVVIMTTNKVEDLDEALIRPGRVDFTVHLGYISQLSAEEMFMRMFAPELLSWARMTTTTTTTTSGFSSMEKNDHPNALQLEEEGKGKREDREEDPLEEYISVEKLRLLARRFARCIPEETFTPCQLQGFFQMYLSSAVEAVGRIEEWVERESLGKGVRDEIVLGG